MTYHPTDDITQRPTAARDLAQLFIGDKLLGSGQARYVYPCALDPTCVVKYEPSGDFFQNAIEWRVWNAIKDFKSMARWFAPCVALSPNGLFLVQKRVKALPKSKYPEKIPDWFGDTKYLNFGMLGRRFVACDYGTPSFSRLMYRQRRLTAADWWGEKT